MSVRKEDLEEMLPGFHIELEAAVRKRSRLGLSAALTAVGAGRAGQAGFGIGSHSAGQSFPFLSLQTWKRLSNGLG